jgi:lipid-binding SYLF domain-containing protein
MPTETRHHPAALPYVLAMAFLLQFALPQGRAVADEAAEARALVEQAKVTLENFLADENLAWFHDNVGKARGVLIVPQLLKGGFLVGASGGSGVFLVRDEKTGQWSYPAFYTLGSVSFGLQIGAQAAEVILMATTEKGVDAFLSNKFQLGADVGIAAGPVGAGAQAATADILAFSRAKGLYGGVSVEGAVIAVRDSLNAAYYGQQGISPVDILIQQSVVNRHADPLRHTLMRLHRK